MTASSQGVKHPSETHFPQTVSRHCRHRNTLFKRNGGATRGRKPLPTALKELEGDRGKGRRPLNKDEPTPPQDNVKCPAWLMPEAKKEWKRLAPSLIAMGVLTEHDMEAFAGYCQAYARWREAEEFLSQHGTIFKTPSGYVQQVPQVSIAMQNLKIMQSFCAEFGLTPASRARLYANSGESAASDDPMESVLKGGWQDVQ